MILLSRDFIFQVVKRTTPAAIETPLTPGRDKPAKVNAPICLTNNNNDEAFTESHSTEPFSDEDSYTTADEHVSINNIGGGETESGKMTDMTYETLKEVKAFKVSESSSKLLTV